MEIRHTLEQFVKDYLACVGTIEGADDKPVIVNSVEIANGVLSVEWIHPGIHTPRNPQRENWLVLPKEFQGMEVRYKEGTPIWVEGE